MMSLSKTTRDAAVFRNVSNGSFSLMPTMERYFIEFAKKDGYNAYFQDHFTSPCRSHLSLHLMWEGWFAQLGDFGTLKGKVPTGVTAGVLRLLKYSSRAQLVALVKLAGEDEGFSNAAVLLEARKRIQKVLERAYKAGGGRPRRRFLTGSCSFGGRRGILPLPWIDVDRGMNVRRASREQRKALCACLGRTVPKRLTHLDTLSTVMNMAITYKVGLKDFTKAEEMYRLSLNFEKSLGKDHEDTKDVQEIYGSSYTSWAV